MEAKRNKVIVIPQKKNPFTKTQPWKKPWVAKNHVEAGKQYR